MWCLRTKTELIPDSRVTSVPFVVFEVGGWCWCCVGVVVAASVCPSSGQTHHTSIPTVVVSLMIHDNKYMHTHTKDRETERVTEKRGEGEREEKTRWKEKKEEKKSQR